MLSFLQAITTLFALSGFYFYRQLTKKPHSFGIYRASSSSRPLFYLKWFIAYILVKLGKRKAAPVLPEKVERPQRLPKLPYVSIWTNLILI